MAFSISAIEKILQKLTQEEKASLTAGSDYWHSTSVDRLDIPAFKLSDGPNGVRGESRDTHPVTSASFPVGTALAATWNTKLVEKIGNALGEEAITKGVQILLGPTVNIQRVPLAGRNFECFSEDPYLTSRIAVAYIKGVQSQGIAACLKHFVCNNQEHNRYQVSAEVSERALQEIYFPAFRAAVKEAEVQAVMAAYNRLNGTHASDNCSLLLETLKGEWGFTGIVISDWYGTYNEQAAVGGCDLEMPGPARWMGQRALVNGKAPDTKRLDDQVRRILRTIVRTGADNVGPATEQSENIPAHRLLIRQAGSEAIVLLKNQSQILPLDPSAEQSIAVIGQLAREISYQGGGSSQVVPHYLISPLEAIKDRFHGEVHYAQGYDIHKQPPTLDQNWLAGTGDQAGALTIQYYANTDLSGTPVHSATCQETSLSWFGETAQYWDPRKFSLRMEGVFQPPDRDEYTLTLSLTGRGRLLIDQEVILDLWDVPAGENQAAANLILDADHIYSLAIEFACDLNQRWRLVRLGAEPSQKPGLLEPAVELAASSDIALIVVGLSPEWESEGFDRESLALPGDQDHLIEKIGKVNPNTVVMVNAGSPVVMPWLESVPAILQTWYLGQESGNAIADVLFGKVEPGGRLPITFPADIKDNPTNGFYPGEEGRAPYQEDIFIGYRHYDAKGIKPLFPFGHGLSYTSFKYENLRLNQTDSSAGKSIDITLDITNTGFRSGQEVVQLYLCDMEAGVERPPKELKGFQKVYLKPGETRSLSFLLRERDLAYFDESQRDWIVEPGDFLVMIGSSSANIHLEEIFQWK